MKTLKALAVLLQATVLLSLHPLGADEISALPPLGSHSAAGNRVFKPLWAPTHDVLPNRGLNHQLIQTVRPHSFATETNQYFRLQPGLSFLDSNGVLSESVSAFELRGGDAVADRLQFKVRVAGNINSAGYLEVTLPSGKHLRSHVGALRYFDPATRHAVVISQVKDAQGFLIAPDQILFPDCFRSVKGDVRYTVSAVGLEQDVLLRPESSLPAPESFGFSAATTRLEVVTEFLSPPPLEEHQSERTPNETDPLASALAREDISIEFGSMRIGPGQAFRAGDPGNRLNVLVGKRWLRLNQTGELAQGSEPVDRQFLIEAVDLSSIAGSVVFASRSRGVGNPVEDFRAIPKAKTGSPGARSEINTTPSQALIDYAAGQALVLDYNQQLSGVGFTNFVFRADTTYFVTGRNDFYGTTTFEGGTVIKMDYWPQNSTLMHTLQIHGPVNCKSSSYCPVFFTARDDDSIGAVLTNSTGSVIPRQYGCGTFTVAWDAPSVDLQNVRFSFCNQALTYYNRKTNHLRNIQFYADGHCLQAGSGSAVYVGNAVMNSCNDVCAISSGAVAVYEHLTSISGYQFHPSYYGSANITLRNCLVMTNAAAGSGDLRDWADGGGNRWLNSISVFASALGGRCYLPLNSSFRDAGVTNIDPILAATLATTTTEAPHSLPGTIATNIVLGPVVGTDTGLPDVGYHYPVIDYACTQINVLGARVTLTNGAVLANGNGSAFLLGEGSSFVSTGAPDKPNTIIWCSMAQETPLNDNTWGSLSVPNATTVHPVISLHFTQEFMPGGGQRGMIVQHGLIPGQLSYLPVTSFLAQDCQFVNMSYYCAIGGADPVSCSFVNNVCVGGVMQFFRQSGASNANTPLAVGLRNNLFYRNKICIGYDTGVASNPAWVVTDNVFDQGIFNNWTYGSLASAPVTVDYNSFDNVASDPTSTGLGGPHNVNLGSFYPAYASGPLGPWYSSTTNWIDAGSQSAPTAGLYHYTTQTTQAKEARTTVDIGFHYVATGWNGRPADVDIDGIADYAENPAGDGMMAPYDFTADMVSGTPWTPPSATGYFPVLEVMSVAPPASASFSFFAPPNARSVWFRMQGLGYQNKGYINCGQTSATVSLNNTNCIVDYPANMANGVGGPFSIIGFTMPSLTIVPNSWNTLNFWYTNTDNVSNGFRVLEVRVLDANGQPMQTVYDASGGGTLGTTTQSLGAINTPYLTYNSPGDYSSNDIVAGAWLWTNAPLAEYNGGPAINAACADCHTTDGSDLKYFGFSDFSIYERSLFHGLTSTQALQIAAFIRNNPEATTGTPWDPPYQPGPGQSAKAYTNWAAGAGLKWVLPHDKRSWAYIFGASNPVVSFTNTLNIRDVPVAIMMPTWNEWLPVIHPKDAYNSNSLTYQAIFGGHPMGYNMSAGYDYALNQATSRNINDVLGFVAQAGYYASIATQRDTNVAGLPQAHQLPYYSFKRWTTVRQWEVEHTRRYEGRAQYAYSTPVDPHTWHRAFMFESAPHFTIDHAENAFPSSPLGDMTQLSWTTKSDQWYWLQLVLNDANHLRGGTGPVDFPYLEAFASTGSIYGFNSAARTIVSLIKAGESGSGDPYDGAPAGGPYDLSKHDDQFTAYGVNRLDYVYQQYSYSTFPEWVGYAPGGRDAIIRAYVNEYDSRVRQLGREYFRDKTWELFDGQTDNNPSDLGQLVAEDVANPDPDNNVRDHSWARDMSMMILRLETGGVASDITTKLHNLAAYLWPTADWSAY